MTEGKHHHGRPHGPKPMAESIAATGVQHVWADFGDGYVIAHLAGGPHENAEGETKYPVQNPTTGKTEDLTLREEADIDAAGSGRTFKSI